MGGEEASVARAPDYGKLTQRRGEATTQKDQEE